MFSLFRLGTLFHACIVDRLPRRHRKHTRGFYTCKMETKMCRLASFPPPSEMNGHLAPDSSAHGEFPRFPSRAEMLIPQQSPGDLPSAETSGFRQRDTPFPDQPTPNGGSRWRCKCPAPVPYFGITPNGPSAPELLLGSAKTFVVTATWPPFFLCAVLSSLPRAGVPKSSCR